MYNKPPRFRKWLELEHYKDKILEAVDGGNLPVWMMTYLSTAFWGISPKWFEKADWMRIIMSFYKILSQSPKLDLPITKPGSDKPKEESWDYDNRTWYLYSHMLAKNYGWTLEYISNLHVVSALATIEEILVDEQLDREFHYGLSEMAYQYDSRSKTSKFNPLPRPHWMRPKIKEIKKFPIPKAMLPFGVDYSSLPPEYRPKEI
jgi:hypothetical protein